MPHTFLLAAVLAAGCPHTVFLSSGRTICSEVPPTSAFGRVIYQSRGRARSLPAEHVDIRRTRAASRGAQRNGSFTVTDVGAVRRAGIDYTPPASMSLRLAPELPEPRTVRAEEAASSKRLLRSYDRMRARSEHRKAERNLQMATQLKAIHFARALHDGSPRATNQAILADALHRQALDRLHRTEQDLDPRDRQKIKK